MIGIKILIWTSLCLVFNISCVWFCIAKVNISEKIYFQRYCSSQYHRRKKPTLVNLRFGGNKLTMSLHCSYTKVHETWCAKTVNYYSQLACRRNFLWSKTQVNGWIIWLQLVFFYLRKMKTRWKLKQGVPAVHIGAVSSHKNLLIMGKCLGKYCQRIYLWDYKHYTVIIKILANGTVMCL